MDATNPHSLVAVAKHARGFRAALADDYSVTVAEEPTYGRALASTGAFLAVLVVGGGESPIPGGVDIEAGADPAMIVAAVVNAMARLAPTQRVEARLDEVGAVPYEEYIELARYAATRRYLMALLTRHGGSVTDAARGAKMKRESLHRLLRRHHLVTGPY